MILLQASSFSEQLSFQTIGLSDRWRQNEDCQFILILAKQIRSGTAEMKRWLWRVNPDFRHRGPIPRFANIFKALWVEEDVHCPQVKKKQRSAVAI